jgi:hypothetical protein
MEKVPFTRPARAMDAPRGVPHPALKKRLATPPSPSL